ncbi:aspartate-alanine antiporter [Undibacterium sp. Dicai25W]|uniref:aspartate-alanine antiporter n=1 Tax=Undibacterium sp. Dicai25W TaxID=3413034 RepID=UPI003BF1C3CE
MPISFVHVLQLEPEITLFLALAIGYALGQIKFGSIQLGGVCGTLIVALLLGQAQVAIDPGIKNVFFVLFIFALGYAGGPQFFANLNAKGLRLALLCLIEVIVVVTLVLLATYWFKFDQGTAAGMLAGAATESAVVGTATDAISKLDLPVAQIRQLQANVVTAYSITYIFGLVTIVIVTSQIFPLLLRINLRQEAEKLWQEMGGNDVSAEAESAVPDVVGRSYRIQVDGQRLSVLQQQLGTQTTIVKVRRNGVYQEITPELALLRSDEILVLGLRQVLANKAPLLGEEFADPDSFHLILYRTEVILKNSDLDKTTLASLQLPTGMQIIGVQRGEHRLPPLPDLHLQLRDVLQVCISNTLSSTDSAVAIEKLGQRIRKTDKSNISFAALGIVSGIAIGMLSLKLGAIPLSLGTGGGALLSGLLFGWYQDKHMEVAGIPESALALLKDLGLAGFIACVGFSSGPQAITLIKQYGVSLPLIGVVVALVPACVSLFVGHFLLKLKAPILLGAIAGQQCSTPAISAIQTVAGNSTPLLGYTITYAVSNIVLPLLGPLIVALAGMLQHAA